MSNEEINDPEEAELLSYFEFDRKEKLRRQVKHWQLSTWEQSVKNWKILGDVAIGRTLANIINYETTRNVDLQGKAIQIKFLQILKSIDRSNLVSTEGDYAHEEINQYAESKIEDEVRGILDVSLKQFYYPIVEKITSVNDINPKIIIENTSVIIAVSFPPSTVGVENWKKIFDMELKLKEVFKNRLELTFTHISDYRISKVSV